MDRSQGETELLGLASKIAFFPGADEDGGGMEAAKRWASQFEEAGALSVPDPTSFITPFYFLLIDKAHAIEIMEPPLVRQQNFSTGSYPG